MKLWLKPDYIKLMEGRETEKAVTISIAMTLLYAFFFMLALASWIFPGIFRHATHQGVLIVMVVSLISIAVMQALLVLALWLRKNNPDSTLPTIIHVYFIGQPLMVLAWLNGVPMMVTGLMLGTMPAFGMVFLKGRHVFYATALIWLEIMLLGLGVSSGLLANAPLYIDAVKTPSYPFAWFFNQIFLGLPELVLVLYIIHSLVENARKNKEEILNLSRRDSLTDLWNRRYLTEVIEHELALAQRTGQALSIIMVDLDHFKQLNDIHGHLVGDSALVNAGKVLKGAVRETDYVGRFGGEEFLVLLPNCDAMAAAKLAEFCRSVIATSPVMHEGIQVSVTASLGIATFQAPSASDNPPLLDKLISRADKALYEAKAMGRNCVVSAPA